MLRPDYDCLAGFATRRRSILPRASRPGERVLIVSSGPGLNLPHLPHGETIAAIDLTLNMVEKTHRRASTLGPAVNASVMAAQHLKFPDESFDAVILNFIVSVVPNPAACVAEVARLCPSVGRLSSINLCPRASGHPSADAPSTL